MTTTLYGAEVSYFTGKVRAYLRWAAIPFEEVLSTADVYRQVIVPAVGAPVIPVLVVAGLASLVVGLVLLRRRMRRRAARRTAVESASAPPIPPHRSA